MDPNSTDAVNIYVDGSSRGNPGPSAIGIIVYARGDDEHPIYEYAKYIGTTTNNIAEYEALIHALTWIAHEGPRPAIIHLDSELVYKQLTGAYRVRNERMAVQLKRVQQLTGSLRDVTFRLVPREKNARANRLAQKASKKHKPDRTTFTQESLL